MNNISNVKVHLKTRSGNVNFNPNPANFFCLEKCLPFLFAACNQVHFRLDFFKEANNINPEFLM